MQEHRRRIARLSSGDSLAVPKEVAEYLDHLRASGASAMLVDGERDGWILMAARWPDAIPALMADKMAQLSDPRVIRLYQLLGRIAESWPDEEPLRETADLMIDMLEQAEATGNLGRQDEAVPDATFVRMMDAFADSSHPAVARLRGLLAERGWTGWTWIERGKP